MLKTSNFIPVIDGLCQEMRSLYAAYIYGYIYLNKQSDNTFDQSLQTIAKRSFLARSTVAKWVKWLVQEGYLIDLTPTENTQAHVYRLTDKASLEAHISFHRVTNFRGGGIRASEGGVSEERTPRVPRLGHMHDVHDDDIWTIILDTWQSIGLDPGAINSAFASYNDLAEFATLLGDWLAAMDDGAIPEDWGYGLIYSKIRSKEKPPAKEVTFGDEVRALMEMRVSGELEYWQARQEDDGATEIEPGSPRG